MVKKALSVFDKASTPFQCSKIYGNPTNVTYYKSCSKNVKPEKSDEKTFVHFKKNINSEDDGGVKEEDTGNHGVFAAVFKTTDSEVSEYPLRACLFQDGMFCEMVADAPLDEFI